MNKILLIANREYTTRVKNKTFLLSTFLLPIVFVGLIAGTTILAIKGQDKHKIAVIDSSNYFKGVLKNSGSISFEFLNGVDTTNYEAKGYTDILVLPTIQNNKLNYILRSPKQVGSKVSGEIDDKINKALQDKMLFANGLNNAMLDSIRQSAPKAEMNEINGTGEKVDSAQSGVVGTVCGFLIYFMMLIYGTQVMRGVMEEKTNRIAEVIVSSVKPMQLMLGKILGIGAVGLTQFILWIVLITGLVYGAQLFISADVMHQVQQMQQMSGRPGAMANAQQFSEGAQNIFEMKQKAAMIPWGLLIPCFLFYFFGGYLFYAALFASVGCMVNEDPQDAQSLMFPITMPIIFGFVIMQSTIQNPNSALAFWGSIIPFTSPIVMMARIASHPPAWQIILSMLLLIGGFLFTGWMAGKIYRIGILMYGKKGNWKEMMKWVFA